MRNGDERYYINVRCYINVRNHYCLLMGAKLFLSKDPAPSQEVLVQVLTTSHPPKEKEHPWFYQRAQVGSEVGRELEGVSADEVSS